MWRRHRSVGNRRWIVLQGVSNRLFDSHGFALCPRLDEGCVAKLRLYQRHVVAIGADVMLNKMALQTGLRCAQKLCCPHKPSSRGCNTSKSRQAQETQGMFVSPGFPERRQSLFIEGL